MANKTFYEKPKRFDKLTKSDYEELAFDLINAFAIVKNPDDSALLLHDLLTKGEIKNLAKRLRIAKLLLSGMKQNDIVEELHCSFATITKVKIWLDEGGTGLKSVIQKLPKRISKPKATYTYPRPNLPKIIFTAVQEMGYSTQKKRVNKFLDNLEKKHLIDKQIREMVNEEFRDLYHARKKAVFKESIARKSSSGKHTK